MKKKILILSVLILFLLTGCNIAFWDTNYQFDKIICNYEGDRFELKISKWTDYEDGEQLQIWSNGKVYLLSANKCYMVKE